MRFTLAILIQLIYSVLIVNLTNNKQKKQKMKQISPMNGFAQKQYNFKVKVNYNNGAVTVHGPNLMLPTFQSNPPIPNSTFAPNMFAHGMNGPSPIPVRYPSTSNNIHPSSPTFSISTASQSQPPQKYFNNGFKSSEDKFTFKPNVMQHGSAAQLIRKQAWGHNQMPTRMYSLENQVQSQQQIDCVICQRKFSKKEFDFHLDLHKNPKRKPNSQEIPTFPTQATKINLISPMNDPNNMSFLSRQQQQIGQSFQQQSKPQLLYSFENKNKNNPNLSFGSQHQRSHQLSRASAQSGGIYPHPNVVFSNVNIHQNPQPNQQMQIVSHNSSGIQNSVRSGNSSMNGRKVQSIPPSGIRYLSPPLQMPNSPNILNQSISSSHQSVPMPPPNSNFNHNPQIQQIMYQQQTMGNPPPPQMLINDQSIMSRRTPSIRSSQMNQSMMSNQAMQQNMSNSKMHQISQQQVMVGRPILNKLINNGAPINPQQKPQRPQMNGSNPFQQMQQQQQSKVYEYFPDSGHYSLSQHRVHTTNDANNYRSFRQNGGFFTQNEAKDLNDLFKRRKTENIQDPREIRSQLSQSSISSIRSYKQPIQNMDKDKLVRTYHNRRNRLDLSNIIGMSQTLAREGYTSKSSAKPIHSVHSSNTKVRNLAADQRRKKVMVASTFLKQQEEKSIYLQHNLNQPYQIQTQTHPIHGNLQMIPIQGRQVFRGTQVEQQDLRAHDSLLNATRSSKSSAKTKIPRNYLAVNQFIVNNKI